MKKPEKKSIEREIGNMYYNQAIDEYEAYHRQEIKIVLDHTERLEAQIEGLPNEGEIETKVYKVLEDFNPSCLAFDSTFRQDKYEVISKSIAKAISKRIRG